MVDSSRSDVRRTYDRIGEHFAATRASPWPEVQTFCNDHDGSTGIDIGCGNGRHATLLGETVETVYAIDTSRTMLETIEQPSGCIHRIQGDASSLPIESGVIDIGVYVATLHHLPTHVLRVSSLTELSRVLQPGAPALVSAWATTHDRFESKTTGFDTTVEWTLPDGTTVDRYYHIVDPEEFADLIDQSPLRVETVWTGSGNCYAIVRGAE